jgi:hypothetical protein
MVLACAFGSGFDEVSTWSGLQGCWPCCWHSGMHNAPNEKCRTMSAAFPHAILHTYITSHKVIGTSGVVQQVAPVLSFYRFQIPTTDHFWRPEVVHIFRKWAQRWLLYVLEWLQNQLSQKISKRSLQVFVVCAYHLWLAHVGVTVELVKYTLLDIGMSGQVCSNHLGCVNL